jgi:hypothetical protein
MPAQCNVSGFGVVICFPSRAYLCNQTRQWLKDKGYRRITSFIPDYKAPFTDELHRVEAEEFVRRYNAANYQ